MSLWQTLFGFQGRINRSLFWLCGLVVILFDLAIVALVSDWVHSQYLAAGAPHRPGGAFVGAGFGLIIVACLSIWMGLALKIKRAHDIGRSGWWLVVGLIPIYGWVVLLYFLGFKKGSARPNTFGEPMGYYPDDNPENGFDPDPTPSPRPVFGRGPITVLSNDEPTPSPFAEHREPIKPPPPDLPVDEAPPMAAFPVHAPEPVPAEPGSTTHLAGPLAVMAMAPAIADLSWLEFGGPRAPAPSAATAAAPTPEPVPEPPQRPVPFHPAMIWGRRYKPDLNWLEFTAYGAKAQPEPEPEPEPAPPPAPELESEPERASPPLILEAAPVKPVEPRPLVMPTETVWTPASSHDSFGDLGPITPPDDLDRLAGRIGLRA